MVSDSDKNGNGRKPFTMNLNPDLMEKFKVYCEKHGYLPSRRIEVLMKKEIEERGGEGDNRTENGS